MLGSDTNSLEVACMCSEKLVFSDFCQAMLQSVFVLNKCNQLQLQVVSNVNSWVMQSRKPGQAESNQGRSKARQAETHLWQSVYDYS